MIFFGGEGVTGGAPAPDGTNPDTLAAAGLDKATIDLAAPATANILAKMACGIADELVSTLALSAHGTCDILLAPAMNTRMWEAPATQANLATLTERGVHIVGPTEGHLACGEVGKGRMAEPADILAVARELLLRRKPKRRR